MVMRVLDNIRCAPGQGLATMYHVPVASSQGYELHEYLAFFLDHGKFDEWTTLLARDVVYRTAAQLSAPAEANASDADDRREYGYDFLVTYAQKLKRTSDGVSKVRRLVTNIIVARGPRHGEFTVGSYLLITGASGTSADGTDGTLTVERHDLIRPLPSFLSDLAAGSWLRCGQGADRSTRRPLLTHWPQGLLTCW